jgi:hypothetical protein
MGASESGNIASMLTQHCRLLTGPSGGFIFARRTITVPDVQSLECLEKAQQVFDLRCRGP